MSFTPQQKTKAYYNAIARGYAELYHDEQRRKLAELRTFLPEDGLVLDLGCGDGILHEFLKETQHIISCDLSLNMLKNNPNTYRIVGSLQALPLQDEIGDTIVSLTALQDLPEPLPAIKEMYRTLKPGGRLIVSFLSMSSRKYDILSSLQDYFAIEKQFTAITDDMVIARKK